jgi:hypothetical protein
MMLLNHPFQIWRRQLENAFQFQKIRQLRQDLCYSLSDLELLSICQGHIRRYILLSLHFSMMDSILNIGVNDVVIRRLLDQTMNPRFAYDVQKRFLQMFGTVVRKVSNENFLKIIVEAKARDGVTKDSELSTQALQQVIQEFKKLVDVPDDTFEQLKLAVEAIFGSWSESR